MRGAVAQINTRAAQSRRTGMETMERAEAAPDVLRDRILLLVAAGGAPLAGRDWLQMGAYLLCRKFRHVGREAGYVPGPAGPYSAAVEGALEGLLGSGLAAEVAGSIFLTWRGREAAERLESGEDGDVMWHVREFKDFVGGMNRDELLFYACRAYPGMTEGSAERRRVEAGADEIALGMVWKGHISRGRAAELLGKSVSYVLRRLKGQGYEIYA